jgi:outer membrane protein assembly factor BamE (lipoprotein component of BamABCDE complex)
MGATSAPLGYMCIMERLKFSLSALTSMTVCLAVAAGITACSSRIDQRGNLPDPDAIANVEVGHINKQGVQDLLGTPSSVSPFDSDVWYYISERTEKVAFFDPKVLERKVIALRFDEKGIVSEMKVLGLEDSNNVQMVDRRTPTAGNEFGLMRQLFGNIGKFEKKSSPQ